MPSSSDGPYNRTNYTIDHAGLLTGIDYPHDTDVSISYDDAGRKTSMIDGSGTTGWTFDNANRCTQIAQPNGTVSYTFDNANRRTQATISGTGNWNWSYDNASRLTSLSNPNSETTSFTLDNAGRCTRTDFANTTYTLNTFDTANRITEIQTKNSGGTQLSDIQYAYDGVNVASRTDTDGTVTSFGYDNSDQLTSESRDNSHSTGYTISYTYDHNQNRATKVLNSVTDTYSYDNHDKLTSTSSKSFYYDSNGNCTSVVVGGNTTSLTWNDDNRCTGITYPSTATNSFVYNGDGLRVSKTDSCGTSAVIADGTTPASPVLKDARAVYTSGISERASGTSKTYHTDALGSTRGITNGSQTVTDTVLYDAFGMTVSRTGSTPTPFGFVGAAQYQSDADSGLQLLGHRMYDPSIGRFISSDPAKDGTNWYAYCENGPVSDTDPTGLKRKPWERKYGNPQEAVYAIAAIAMQMSHNDHNNEYGGSIVENPDGTVTPTKPVPIGRHVGTPHLAKLAVAYYHTHPANNQDTSDTDDQSWANGNKMHLYAINEFGHIWINHPDPAHPIAIGDDGKKAIENQIKVLWPAQKLPRPWK